MPTLPPFPLRPEVRVHLERVGLDFLAEFLECVTRRDPGNLEALAELAHVLTKLGRTEEGLAADRRLVVLAPHNPTVHYNLACSLSLLGRNRPALDALARAVELGYDDVDHLLEDSDLVGLHAETRFQDLVDQLRSSA